MKYKLLYTEGCEKKSLSIFLILSLSNKFLFVPIFEIINSSFRSIVRIVKKSIFFWLFQIMCRSCQLRNCMPGGVWQENVMLSPVMLWPLPKIGSASCMTTRVPWSTSPVHFSNMNIKTATIKSFQMHEGLCHDADIRAVFSCLTWNINFEATAAMKIDKWSKIWPIFDIERVCQFSNFGQFISLSPFNSCCFIVIL